MTQTSAEEIGVVIGEEDVEFAHVMHNSSSGGRVAFFFTVCVWSGMPENREPNKCSELRWFPLSALPEHLVGYCRVALAHIAAGQAFSVYGW
jgi:8-oxo-dGTP diphosphatase